MGIARAGLATIKTDDASELTVDLGSDGGQVFDEFDEIVVGRRTAPWMTTDPHEL